MMGHTHEQLGSVTTRIDIPSSLAPFRALDKYKTLYPRIVIEALADLYVEYNRAFEPLIQANQEWGTDYQYCRLSDGSPVNCLVQIDMVGLPQAFLDAAVAMSRSDLREILRGKIFEIENSLAMYQLLERIFSSNARDSFFKPRFRAALNDLRRRFGIPVALLAVTDQKHAAMMESEFGRQEGESLSDTEVRDLSGFDRFFGPQEFRDYLVANGGRCGYLLYARTSDPVAKLKKPNVSVDHPLLGDPEMRRLIKAHAVTFNVDDPQWSSGDPRRINDTKGYMPTMGMGFPIAAEIDFLSSAFVEHLSRKNGLKNGFSGERLNPEFVQYLRAQRLDPDAVATGQVVLRGKPLKGAYGCYGHVSGNLMEGDFRSDLRRNLRARGGYILQPELAMPRITNSQDGGRYAYIDRNFFGMVDGRPVFLGGFRSLMPLDTTEAQKGRVHGNEDTVWAEIVSSDA